MEIVRLERERQEASPSKVNSVVQKILLRTQLTSSSQHRLYSSRIALELRVFMRSPARLFNMRNDPQAYGEISIILHAPRFPSHHSFPPDVEKVSPHITGILAITLLIDEPLPSSALAVFFIFGTALAYSLFIIIRHIH